MPDPALVITFLLGVCLGIVSREIADLLTPSKKAAKIEVVSVERAPDGDRILTISDGRQVRGLGTVWHFYPSGNACSTSLESRIHGAFKRHQWAAELLKKQEVEVVQQKLDADLAANLAKENES